MKNAAPRKYARFKLFALICAALVGMAAPVAASSTQNINVMGLDLSKIDKPSAVPFAPEAAFEAATRLETEAAPYDDRALAYEIRVPKDWTDNVQGTVGEIQTDSKVLSDTVLSILGRYIAKPVNLRRSYVVVEGMMLGYEINIRDWFLNFVLKNGFSLTALDERSSKELEGLYVQVTDDQAYLVRARAIISGSRLIMVRYYLPQENIQTEKPQQAQVIHSFKLSAPSAEAIEKRAEHGFLDQSYFDYPASWTLQARKVYSIERMDALLYKKSGEDREAKQDILDGQIKIKLVSRLLKTSLADEIKAFREGSAIKGYQIGKMIEEVKYTYHPSMTAGKTQIYELVPEDKVSMKSYEMVVSILQNDDFYYFVTLITPARQNDFYIWARNMEAYKIVTGSFRRNNLPVGAADPNDPYYDYLKDPQ